MKPLIAMLALAVAAAPAAAQRPGIASAANKHNLSTTGPGPIKSATVTEICVFCHAPHNTRPQRPLWNQELSGEAFTPYASSTIAAQPGQPTGASKLCLSCHDGTVAMGRTMNGGTLSLSGTDQGRLPVGSPSIIGTNLSNDHPISFAPVPGPQITMPPQGDAVALDRNGQLQCTSCHDPHEQDRDQTTRKFLVKSNQASGLCVTCHRKDYWGSNPSTHKTSTTTYDAALGAHTGYTTVSNNGCESCHKPHAAGWPARLLKQDEAQTCGTAAAQCHGGRIPTTKNIYQEMNGTKMYRHPSFSQTSAQTHDAAESPTHPSKPLPELSITASRHAACSDCHNPHASYNQPATRPKAGGKLAGVWGIKSDRSVALPIGLPPSVNEYEICFKCHADSANKPQIAGADIGFGPLPVRQVNEFNKRMAFDPLGISFHPVTAPGRSLDVPSLISPWTSSSVMYCTDCHDNSDGPRAPGGSASNPAGPHASQWPHLLVARYVMTDNTSYTASNAALCFKCHSAASIMGDVSFEDHKKHIEGERSPCFVCHDPHGVKSGVPITQKRLINFALKDGNGLTIVTPSSSGRLEFVSTGNRRGSCYLRCHGKNHNPLSYGN